MLRLSYHGAVAALAFSLGLLSKTSAAQDASSVEGDEVVDASASEEDDLVVVVRGARREGTFSDPRAVTVINSDEIQESAPGSVPAALRETPGVSIQQTTPGQGTVYVRGLSGRAVGHMVDGVRLNTAFYRAGNNPYLGLVDTYSLSQVTIAPGAQSVEYGSDALGGAILMDTRLPGYTLLEPSYQGALYSSVSSNPLGTVAHGSIERTGRVFSWNYGITHVRAGDIRPGRSLKSPEPSSYRGLERDAGAQYKPELVAPQSGTAFDFVGSNISAQRTWDRLELVVRGQIGVRPELTRYDQITPRFKREYPRRADAAVAPMSRLMTSVALNHRPFNSWYQFAQVLLGWQRISETTKRRDFEERCVDNFSGDKVAQGGCTRFRLQAANSSIFERNRSDAFTLRAMTSSSWAQRWTLRLGAEGHFDHVGSQVHEFQHESGEQVLAASRYPDGSSTFEGGIYSKLEYEGPLLSAFLGLRGMGFSLNIAERNENGVTPGYQRSLFDYSVTSGLRIAIARSAALVFTLGRGVRMPNVADLAGLGARAKGRFQVPNPSLTAEHSYTTDVGIKLRKNRFRFDTFVFFTRYADAIVLQRTDVDGEEFSESEDRFYRSENASRVDYYGLDSHGEIPLTGTVSIFGRWLAMIGQQDNSGGEGQIATPADRVPPYQGETGLRLFPHARWKLQAHGRWRARQSRLNDPINLDDNRIPEEGTPGYLTLHARATYRLRDNMVAAILLDNFTNRLVLDHGSGFYGPGFSATASFSASLR